MPDYWKQYEGKTVPLKGLLQWLSDEHEHVTDDEGELLEGWEYAVVDSMALHRWAIAEATEDEYKYEYTIAMRRTDFEDDWSVSTSWKADLDRERRGMEAMQRVCKEREYPFEYKLVKRRKPREVVVEDV